MFHFTEDQNRESESRRRRKEKKEEGGGKFPIARLSFPFFPLFLLLQNVSDQNPNNIWQRSSAIEHRALLSRLAGFLFIVRHAILFKSLTLCVCAYVQYMIPKKIVYLYTRYL